MRKTHKWATAFGLAVLLVLAGGHPASAAEYIQPSVSCRECGSYARVPISMNGRALDLDARLIDGTTYVPLRAFAEAMGAHTVGYDAKSRTASVEGQGISLSVSDGGRLLTANGRCLYHDAPAVILSDNRLYVPLRPIARAYGLSVSWDVKTRSVSLGGRINPIASGHSYYREDEVYWLARIISAEARGEPFLGQIAVGNVVLNRVRSPYYPNTIYGVIFDRAYGVQFAPVANGTVYAAPTPSAILAAKVVLDGYSISDEALYFIEPRKATSYWVPNNRTYLLTVGAHYFYK